MDANQARFKNFPSSLYTASKLLQVGNQSKTYAVCPSCNSLYNIAEVVAEEGSKCTHVEFSMQSKGKPCGMELTMQAPLGNRNKNRPKLLFPLPSLKLQINSLYQRSGIQQQLRKWTNRHVDNGMLTDIYDGAPYFTPETADSHLGIMINLDWFQPFESSAYSCGAIYGVVCNLPREIRFKKENMLTLGLLPGPNEIIKKLWIDGNKITKHDLELMEKRAKIIKIPADLGRIPNKIITGDGFSGFTANQWKSFILIYAIPLMWDLLNEPDRKILGNFVRACTLLICRIIDDKTLSEAHEHLLKVAMLIEENYGPERITPNFYLCLHIADCCRDYGPLYSFWCYSFERMNGILGSFPNSHRQIEPELLRIIMQHWRLDDLISVQSNNTKLVEALKLIKPRATSGSLAAYDNFEFSELCQYRKIFVQEVDDTIVGNEPFSGEMLTPRRIQVDLPDNIYQILTDYYSNDYDLQFTTIADSISSSSRDSIVVPNMIDQFGRVQIAAEIFGSAMSSRYLKNACILAKFIQENRGNETTDLFPGQVQYYFEHTITISGESKTHRLAFVRWYRLAPN
ncbi:hypothetical protein RhiirA5_383060 [Rhizophagus irregularis]|uniref:Transposase domain-containing protein n=2 Tax=Rhizophagus irregularis TaxID=588596 RepID=A0A2N0NYG3_9GLOM|nr:hypothetical protein RhiirA5_383060 [Rhizophagus irregularis]